MTTDNTITLSEDQQNAFNDFTNFIFDPVESVFVLSGYSGCGKSTLVTEMLKALPKIFQTATLLNPNYKPKGVWLTATTNKAAENLHQITKEPVATIHSFLGLRVHTDFKTGESRLVPFGNTHRYDEIIFIDEASYIDKLLLQLIFERTTNCKIIFIGDPAQLTAVKSVGAPVFEANFRTAALTKVMRQAEGNPIITLATMFRNFVNTGEMVPFTPDGKSIIHMDKNAFFQEIEKEFTRPNWKHSDSKILGWTNKCVVSYNHFINSKLRGSPHFNPGDYAMVNSFITPEKGRSLKTDQMVIIDSIEPDDTQHGVVGNWFTLNQGYARAFMPKHMDAKAAALKEAKARDWYARVMEIENTWIDLRSAFACTVNKSQGSTYDRVYIDLGDIARCNSGNQVARLLYVAVSRARHQVFLTGDLV